MNCQDISRIVDSGSIRNLSEAQRSGAESHARFCRECAAIWGVQSRLAVVRVPATPPQVAARFRAMATMLEEPVRGRFTRRLTLIGGLVALAAAAALLAVHEAGTPLAEPSAAKAPESAVMVIAVEEPVATPVTAKVAVSVAAAAAPAKPANRRLVEPVLLLPPPISGSSQAARGVSLVDPALQKAVERYPELVEGPQIEGTFVVGLALKADGSVLTSAIRHAPPGGVATANAEINVLIPGEDEIGGMVSAKSTRLRDGRTLRADVLMTIRSIPEGFDLTRSRARVLQILGDKYAHLMVPVTDGGLNRLEVFLSEDGSILREHVDVVREGDSGVSVTNDPAAIARFAEGIAARLGLDVRQIGVVGLTGISQGPAAFLSNPAGGMPLMQNQPRMLINYAWARRAGESAPTLGGGATPGAINQAVALAIVERYVPGAFTTQNSVAGQPAVILSAGGEFVRAGRLHLQASTQLIMMALQEQMAGGRPLSTAKSVKLTNAAGVTVDVYFAWERPEAEPANPAN